MKYQSYLFYEWYIFCSCFTPVLNRICNRSMFYICRFRPKPMYVISVSFFYILLLDTLLGM